jgi:hypothetical protein
MQGKTKGVVPNLGLRLIVTIFNLRKYPQRAISNRKAKNKNNTKVGDQHIINEVKVTCVSVNCDQGE